MESATNDLVWFEYEGPYTLAQLQACPVYAGARWDERRKLQVGWLPVRGVQGPLDVNLGTYPRACALRGVVRAVCAALAPEVFAQGGVQAPATDDERAMWVAQISEFWARRGADIADPRQDYALLRAIPPSDAEWRWALDHTLDAIAETQEDYRTGQWREPCTPPSAYRRRTGKVYILIELEHDVLAEEDDDAIERLNRFAEHVTWADLRDGVIDGHVMEDTYLVK